MDRSRVEADRDAWWVWAAIGLVYAGLRINLVDIPLTRDEGSFGLVGRRILEGEVPYRDALENRPPLGFYLYSLALLLVPASARGLHLFLHVYNFLTLLVLHRAGRRLLGVAGGRLTALAFAVLSSSSGVQGFTGSSEMLLLLPLAAGLLLALRGTDAGVRHGALAASGACAAAACWIKQPAAPMALFVLSLVIVRAGRRGALRGGAAWLAGAVALSLGVLAYFAAHGAAEGLFYWSFLHGMLYARGAARPDQLARWLAYLWEAVSTSPGVLVAALLGLTALAGRGARIAAAFALAALASTAFGPVYRHYFAMLAPALALLAGAGLARVLAWTGAQRTAAVALGAKLVALQLTASPGYYLQRTPEGNARAIFGGNPFALSVEIADLLRRDADPDDRVLVLGSEPQIPLLSGLRSATSFIVVYPLTTTVFPRHREFQQRLIDEFESRPPAYVVAVALGASTSWDGEAPLQAWAHVEGRLARDYQWLRTWLLDAERVEWRQHPGPVPPQGSESIRVFRRRP